MKAITVSELEVTREELMFPELGGARTLNLAEIVAEETAPQNSKGIKMTLGYC